jgi:hypothetical protein
MIRVAIVLVTLAVGVAVLTTSEAGAQSPDPALLAPGQSGRLMAPARTTDPRPSYMGSTAGGHATHMSRHGRQLSHPSMHNHG